MIVHEHAQFLLGNRKFRDTAIQTDQKLRKDPHYGFVQTLEASKVNGDLPIKIALIQRFTRLARHLFFAPF